MLSSANPAELENQVNDFLEKCSGSYTREVDGHRVLVMPVSGGKGYHPVDLMAANKYEEAARVAKLAWDRRL